MWTRTEDGSVVDDTGKVIYFSLERFVRDIGLGDCCFICGASPSDVPFNNEHVIPEWILRRFGLFDRSLTLPNGTSMRYDRYTVPCCVACNGLMGRVIEQPIGALTEGGYDAVNAWREQHGILNLYVWIGLLFLKTHLKDRTLRVYLDARKGHARIAEELQYDWGGLHYLHTLVRCFATGTGIHTDALGSFFIVKVRGDASGQVFDYGDLYHSQSVMLRLGDVAFIACFNDGGNAGLFLKQKLDRITGAVSDVQLRELATELAFLNVHLKDHPKLQSYFDLELERHEMRGSFVMPELVDLDYAIRGKLMHYVFRDMFGKVKSYRWTDQEFEAMVVGGRATFLFDDHGAFIKDDAPLP